MTDNHKYSFVVVNEICVPFLFLHIFEEIQTRISKQKLAYQISRARSSHPILPCGNL